MRIILASGSPRRKELLSRAGFLFDIIPAEGEETITGTDPAEIVENLSRQKASEVSDRILREEEPGTGGDFLVIGADTVVSYQGRILGKPGSCEEAAEMLRMLNGRTHQVFTGVTVICVRDGQKAVRTFHECTDVVFREVPESVILSYVSTGEPMDKAGAYAIQGGWGPNVEKIRGDYDNVVGLPVAHLLEELKSMQGGC